MDETGATGVSIKSMKSLLTLLLLCGSTAAQIQPPAPILHFTHGQWFDGTAFQPDDFYVEQGLLTHKPSSTTNADIIDLHDQFVVPPYGDAHEHNFDGTRGIAALTAAYLRDGIFYAQGMTDTTVGANEVVVAHLVDTPETVDVTYAHGGLTGIDGHPKEVYESLAIGKFYYPATPEQVAQVRASHLRAGQAYWEIDSPADLAAKWPKILSSKPDFIKIYLTESEKYTADSHLQPGFAKGLDPALVPLITARAHAAGLKVAAHIDTAIDFHIAVTGNVDEMGHLPGYEMNAADDPAIYRLADADISLAARHHVKVQATAGIGVYPQLPAVDLKARQAVQTDNLRRLKAAAVPILVGSDHYGQDALNEADYLQSLGLWTNLEMLRMWSVATPQTIFPKRKIAQLQPGYEASFLVLSANPLLSWPAAHQITDRWKQGQHLLPAPPANRN